MSTGVVQVADRVWQIAVVPYVNIFAIRDDDGVTLVDTALQGRAEAMISKLGALGIRPTDIRRILLTHCHPDHAGGAGLLLERGASPEVRVGPADVPTVRGDAPQPPRDPSTFLGRMFERFTGGDDAGIPAVGSVTAIEDGEELAVGGGCVAVATPGHTPGHTAFHLPSRGLLIGGDVLFNVFSLRPSPGFLCSDIAVNRASIVRLAEREPSILVLAHGDPVNEDPAGKLRELAT